MRSKKSWREKLEKEQQPEVVPMPERMARQYGAGTLLIPTPLEVDAVIREVPSGALITTGEIRSRLARRHGATTTCPLVTGIFVRISAEAAHEDEQDGRQPITPYWRVVTDAGRLNPKFPGGAEAQARRLEAEGHRVELRPREKVPAVAGFQESVVVA